MTSPRTLTLEETAHRLRMTTWLVRWLTQNDVCGGNRLRSTGSPPAFDAGHVEEFDLALKGPWPSKNVPAEIARELRREARGMCGLCGEPNDRLEEAHIRRKDEEQAFHCQHPYNLLLMCPNCHSRYDADLVPYVAVEHAKQLAQAKLMEAIDRDILAERVLREEIRKMVAGGVGFADAARRMIASATGRTVEPESHLEAVSALIATAREVGGEQPLTGGLLMGTAFEGELDEDLDSFKYLESLAQPLPTREEFDDEFDGYRIRDGHDPSHMLVAWAAAADAAYECAVCPTVCIDPDGLSDALTEHWKELHEEAAREAASTDDEDDDGEEDEEAEEFDETAVRDEVYDDIVNSGVECGDIWGSSGMCAYHANAMSKDD